LVLFNGFGYCKPSGLSDYTYAENATQIVDDEVSRLTYVKIGIAIGMFAITAAACSFPFIVISCITRRICSRRCFGSRSSALNSPSYASGTEEVDAASPTFLLDPQANESDDVLLTRNSDSHRSRNHHVGSRRISLYDVDSHESSSVSRENSHRLNMTNSGASGTDVTDTLNGREEINGNGAISPSTAASIRTTRKMSQRRNRLLKTWASRINCFAAGIFLTTGEWQMSLFLSSLVFITYAWPSKSLCIDPVTVCIKLLGIPVWNFGLKLCMALLVSPHRSEFAILCGMDKPLVKMWANYALFPALMAGLLFIGLMDLFPDVNDAIEIALSALKINTHYPFAALFTLFGFFMVLTIEQGAHVCHRKHRSIPTSDADAPHNHHEHGGGHSHHNEIISEAAIGTSTFQVMLLLISLSVHSVFEGLAVGLQRSVSEVVALFSALLLHKLIMAASIGFSLATSHQQQVGGIARSQWMGALFFSLASPIGVLIGWPLIAQRSSPALLMAIAVLQGLACGTFFFVVFCEMLPREFGENEKVGIKDRFGKIVSLILGFALIAIYIALGPE
uniref:Zinc/iron permease n=1 Tax=Rodentolepis nana TaxID=102285 RepID=A0A158QIH9_RODNA